MNGNTYKPYKKCPMIASYLFDLHCRCASKAIVPVQWRIAKLAFAAKADSADENNIAHFRDIALLNVEGKLFFSLVSQRLTHHIVHRNRFLNTSIQKGCMEGIPGCWEHMASLWDTLKDARSNSKTVATAWLDIASAYGSIPHRLIFFALERYGVDPTWFALIKSYYSGLWSRSCSPTAASSWHQQKKGIFTGCTVSIILFLAGMSVFIEFVSNVTIQGYINAAGVSLPLIRAFMDDLNLTSTSTEDTQTLLDRCQTVLQWAGMQFRAKKSRSLVINEGAMSDATFYIAGVQGEGARIPTVLEQPIVFLGRTIDGTLSDQAGRVS